MMMKKRRARCPLRTEDLLQILITYEGSDNIYQGSIRSIASRLSCQPSSVSRAIKNSKFLSFEPGYGIISLDPTYLSIPCREWLDCNQKQIKSLKDSYINNILYICKLQKNRCKDVVDRGNLYLAKYNLYLLKYTRHLQRIQGCRTRKLRYTIYSSKRFYYDWVNMKKFECLLNYLSVAKSPLLRNVTYEKNFKEKTDYKNHNQSIFTDALMASPPKPLQLSSLYEDSVEKNLKEIMAECKVSVDKCEDMVDLENTFTNLQKTYLKYEDEENLVNSDTKFEGVQTIIEEVVYDRSVDEMWRDLEKKVEEIRKNISF